MSEQKTRDFRGTGAGAILEPGPSAPRKKDEGKRPSLEIAKTTGATVMLAGRERSDVQNPSSTPTVEKEIPIPTAAVGTEAPRPATPEPTSSLGTDPTVAASIDGLPPVPRKDTPGEKIIQDGTREAARRRAQEASGMEEEKAVPIRRNSPIPQPLPRTSAPSGEFLTPPSGVDQSESTSDPEISSFFKSAPLLPRARTTSAPSYTKAADRPSIFPRKRNWVSIMVMVIVVAIIVVGLGFYKKSRQSRSTTAAAHPKESTTSPPPVCVDVTAATFVAEAKKMGAANLRVEGAFVERASMLATDLVFECDRGCYDSWNGERKAYDLSKSVWRICRPH